MKLKNIFILALLLLITISCNSGDDYLGNWYNKKYNQILFISKAGNKGYLIRLYGGKNFFSDESKYFIFEDGYFYLTEEDRKKNRPTLIIQNKNQIISSDGFLFTKK